MNLEEFNALSIEEQVEYINIQLETTSLNKACFSLGVSESTVRDRFKRNNYKRVNKKFVPLDTTETTTNTDIKVTPIKTISKKPTKRAERKDTNLDSIKLLEEKIKALESQLEATNKRIDNINTTKTTITTDTSNIRVFDGEEVVRSFRVNEDVQKRFKSYCKAHSDNKVSDILSTILDEYLKSQDY